MKQTLQLSLWIFSISCLSFLLLTGCQGNQESDSGSGSAIAASGAAMDATSENGNHDSLLPEDIQTILDTNTHVPLDTIPESLTVLANRTYLLPADYEPKDLVYCDVPFGSDDNDDKHKLKKPAAKALEKLFAAARKEDLILYGVSGYRSYERQTQIYKRNVSIYGYNSTNTFSAKPGSSEHQTGLAVDISCSKVDYLLKQRFATTREGKWVTKHAHEFGFVIRFPKEKEEITGYEYEPWHIRYLGKELATYLYEHDLTLEEYYGISAKR